MTCKLSWLILDIPVGSNLIWMDELVRSIVSISTLLAVQEGYCTISKNFFCKFNNPNVLIWYKMTTYRRNNFVAFYLNNKCQLICCALLSSGTENCP